MLSADLTYGLLFVSLYIEVFMLVAFLERFFKPRTAAAVLPADLPSVAIIVPCFNEEAGVAGTIRSLLSLQYPQRLLEIIVVDDGSTDKTLEIARSFAHDPRVSVYHKENGGKYTAMNFGLSKTSADLIGCLDADSFVAPDALARVAPIFQNAQIGAVTPAIHVKDPRRLIQHMQLVEYRASLFIRYVLSSIGSAYITPGPFSIFRADIVRKLGGWREAHMTEDMELALRLQERGFLIANAPQVVVHTTTPSTVPRLFKQRVRWNYGFIRNAIDYRHIFGNRSYGNLGLLIFPAAAFSFFAVLYFFFKMLFGAVSAAYHEYLLVSLTGSLPKFSFDLFFFNTSMMFFLVIAAIVLVLALVSIGSEIGTGKRTLPIATPLFIFLYGFLVPFWLGTALVRAAFRTGVRWR